MRKFIGVFVSSIMILSMLSGCSTLQKIGLQKGDSEELHPVSSVVLNESDAKKLSDKVPVHLYFANEDNTKLKMEIRYVQVSEVKKSVNNLASVIVKETISGSKAGLKATIPEGTKLRSPVAIEEGIATVDFTSDFVDKHPGGINAEQLTIFSIVNSLTELKEIQKVKFTVNGKERKDFKGSFEIDDPFTRNMTLVDKAVPSSAADTSSSTSQSVSGDESSLGEYNDLLE